MLDLVSYYSCFKNTTCWTSSWANYPKSDEEYLDAIQVGEEKASSFFLVSLFSSSAFKNGSRLSFVLQQRSLCFLELLEGLFGIPVNAKLYVSPLLQRSRGAGQIHPPSGLPWNGGQKAAATSTITAKPSSEADSARRRSNHFHQGGLQLWYTGRAFSRLFRIC